MVTTNCILCPFGTLRELPSLPVILQHCFPLLVSFILEEDRSFFYPSHIHGWRGTWRLMTEERLGWLETSVGVIHSFLRGAHVAGSKVAVAVHSKTSMPWLWVM